ncbi:MAG: hypothetical protein HYS15_02880, partial [Candidatus Spechtbacteria bacterium]|nr:hypothetical protein [Candidatus Spechtbacteria bacterium]
MKHFSLHKDVFSQTLLFSGVFLGSLVFLFAAARLVAGAPPGCDPPGCNVAPPLRPSPGGSIDVGNDADIINIDALVGFNDLFLKGNTGETAPIYYGASEHRFYTNGTEKLTILNNGNVGIGTAGPDSKLQILGVAGTSITAPSGLALLTTNNAVGATVGIRFDVISTGQTSAAISAIQIGDTTSGAADLAFVTRSTTGGGSTGERMRITGAGNVGIGTANSASGARLTVRADDPSLQINTSLWNGNAAAANVGPALYFAGAATPVDMGHIGMAWDGAATTDSYMRFTTRGGNALGERMRITSGGNVGIGIAIPGYKLDVQGGQINASGGLCIAGVCQTSWSSVGGADNLGNHIATTNLNMSGFNITGVNTLTATKLTATTIDPVYEINGKKYATYVSDVAGGVKTEVTGTINVKCQSSNVKCQYVVDFDEQKVGSDLWLFWQTSNKNINDV